jgi:hypothetical protein
VLYIYICLYVCPHTTLYIYIYIYVAQGLILYTYRAASRGWAKPPGVRGLKLLVCEALSSIYTYIGRRLSGGRSLSKDVGGGGKEETGGTHAALGLVHTPLSVGMYYTYVCVYIYTVYT